jgi:hypothetical protein
MKGATDSVTLFHVNLSGTGRNPAFRSAWQRRESKIRSTPGLIKILAAVVFFASAMLSEGSLAQPQSRSLKEEIVGTWSAVSQYVDQDGKKLEPFGPKGMVVYDSNGRFILVLQRASLPNFASNNRMTGTAEENKAVVQGSIAYFGRYSVNENDQKINLHYDGSTYPNWDGEDQTRLISITGDQLSISSPVSAVGGGTVHLGASARKVARQ